MSVGKKSSQGDLGLVGNTKELSNCIMKLQLQQWNVYSEIHPSIQQIFRLRCQAPLRFSGCINKGHADTYPLLSCFTLRERDNKKGRHLMCIFVVYKKMISSMGKKERIKGTGSWERDKETILNRLC